MRVLQISPYFPPHVGGIEFHVKGLCEGLIKRGYDVEVASSCGICTAKFVRIPCIDCYYFPFRKAAPHVVTYHNDVLVPARVNGYKMPRSLRASLEWINRKLVEPILDRAQIVIATTRSYAETSPVLKRYLHKIEIVPNAVDIDLFQPGIVREPYILYVGRLVDYKGIEMLLQAAKLVQSKEDYGDQSRFHRKGRSKKARRSHVPGRVACSAICQSAGGLRNGAAVGNGL